MIQPHPKTPAPPVGWLIPIDAAGKLAPSTLRLTLELVAKDTAPEPAAVVAGALRSSERAAQYRPGVTRVTERML